MTSLFVLPELVVGSAVAGAVSFSLSRRSLLLEFRGNVVASDGHHKDLRPASLFYKSAVSSKARETTKESTAGTAKYTVSINLSVFKSL